MLEIFNKTIFVYVVGVKAENAFYYKNIRMNDLISKYFNQSASREEIEELLDWIKMSKENETCFLELRKIWYMSEVTDLSEDRIYEALTKTNRKITQLKRREDKKKSYSLGSSIHCFTVHFLNRCFFYG